MLLFYRFCAKISEAAFLPTSITVLDAVFNIQHLFYFIRLISKKVISVLRIIEITDMYGIEKTNP